MAGGSQFQRQDAAIIALLNTGEVQAAAKQAGIGQTTLWRWLREDEAFQLKYRKAKQQAIDTAVGRLSAICSVAVEVLLEVAKDQDAPASARVSAAKGILDSGEKIVEREQVICRLEAIEQKLNVTDNRKVG